MNNNREFRVWWRNSDARSVHCSKQLGDHVERIISYSVTPRSRVKHVTRPQARLYKFILCSRADIFKGEV